MNTEEEIDYWKNLFYNAYDARQRLIESIRTEGVQTMLDKEKSDKLRSQLKKVYEHNKDWKDVLKALSISEDEFNKNELNQKNEVKTLVYGIKVVSNFSEREFYLTCLKRFYDNDDMHWVKKLLNG